VRQRAVAAAPPSHQRRSRWGGAGGGKSHESKVPGRGESQACGTSRACSPCARTAVRAVMRAFEVSIRTVVDSAIFLCPEEERR